MRYTRESRVYISTSAQETSVLIKDRIPAMLISNGGDAPPTIPRWFHNSELRRICLPAITSHPQERTTRSYFSPFRILLRTSLSSTHKMA